MLISVIIGKDIWCDRQDQRRTDEILELDQMLKFNGPVYRSSRQYAADPCVCTHPRSLHGQHGGCKACLCDMPADVITAFAG